MGKKVTIGIGRGSVRGGAVGVGEGERGRRDKERGGECKGARGDVGMKDCDLVQVSPVGKALRQKYLAGWR